MRTWHVQLAIFWVSASFPATGIFIVPLIAGRVNVLEGARLPGDALFIMEGVLPLVWLCWQALRYPNPQRIDAETELPRLLYTYESDPRQPWEGDGDCS